MMVLNAKSTNPKITMYFPIEGRPCSYALDVRAAPFTPDNQLWLNRITKAVIVQTIIVSISGSSIETDPCFIGLFVLAAACAIGELPSPASLEKTPRDTPNLIAIQIVAPAKPPLAALPVKADSMIIKNIVGI